MDHASAIKVNAPARSIEQIGPRSNWARPAPLLRFALTAALGVFADLYFKHWAGQQLGNSWDEEPRRVIHFWPGWIDLEWTRNYGAALGSFQGHRWMFLGVSAVAVIFLSYLFSTAKPRQWFFQIVLGVLMAGVIGNMYDRVVLGSVRDMIHALPDRHFPDAIAAHLPRFWAGSTELFPWIFNIADSFLCVGVGLMLVHSFVQPDPKRVALLQDADPQST